MLTDYTLDQGPQMALHLFPFAYLWTFGAGFRRLTVLFSLGAKQKQKKHRGLGNSFPMQGCMRGSMQKKGRWFVKPLVTIWKKVRFVSMFSTSTHFCIMLIELLLQ